MRCARCSASSCPSFRRPWPACRAARSRRRCRMPEEWILLPCAILDAEKMARRVDGRWPRQPGSLFTLISSANELAAKSRCRREARWRRLLAPYFREAGYRACSAPTSNARLAFTRRGRPPHSSACRRASIFGLPSADLDTRQGRGAKVRSSATTVDEALWLEAHGVGRDCGAGHWKPADIAHVPV